MSRGRQHRTWASYPKNRELMEKVQRAHFQHFSGNGSGLTYQSCRFCGEACHQSEDRDHGANCWFIKNTGAVCRGLWKYNVRHYLCSDCRKDVLLGLRPAKARGRAGGQETA